MRWSIQEGRLASRPEALERNSSLLCLRGILVLAVLACHVNFFASTPWLSAAQDELPTAVSEDGVWMALDADSNEPGAASDSPSSNSGRQYLLDTEAFDALLRRAPLDVPTASVRSGVIFSVPMPNGDYSRFFVVEAPVMEPGLAAKFPEIRTYRGQGIDDPTATLRMGWTSIGFHAQVLTGGDVVLLQPASSDELSVYVSSLIPDQAQPFLGFECLTGDVDSKPATVASDVESLGDGMLRTYRFACATTGEFTAYFGGTVEVGLARVVTNVNRLNGILEKELGVRLLLVANNDLVIYTDPDTDPYSNPDPFLMAEENKIALANVIGSGNFDVGHVFGRESGSILTGVAGVGVPCKNAEKAAGVTNFLPIGDFFFEVFAHEVGHQFGTGHTFNTISAGCDGNRSAETAYEPGAGSTLMSYAGILCPPDNFINHRDYYYHSGSLSAMYAYVSSGAGATCPAIEATGNTAPVVDAGPDYVIPQSTPFKLTANGNDPDGDPITYCWEERDLGPPAGLADPDNGFSPLVRSFPPTSAPLRRIPFSGSASTLPGEKLPTTDRMMKFRAMVRDNRSDGGAVGFDEMQITVDADSGPFRLTFGSNGLCVGGEQTITWSVAGTDLPPVNASTVDILLSIDGGTTYPFILAEDTPNDGSEVVLFPPANVATARIRIEANGNIFYDATAFNLEVAPNSDDCNGNEVPDGCDIRRGLSRDCNENIIPDECEIALLDCNQNFTPDDCDISYALSKDCNANSIPDECDIAALDSLDCNLNAVPDECDLGVGLSEDCNENTIPDECDVASTTSPDCNFNAVPDECDLASGTSNDENANGIPDDCDPLHAFGDPSGIDKVRFISFVIASDADVAIRVRPVPALGFGSENLTGTAGTYWVGPPSTYLESSSSGESFHAAHLQCIPHYQNWSDLGLLHVTGSAIVPSSVYEIVVLDGTCVGTEGNCIHYSNAIEFTTTRWGDVVEPFNPPSTTTQPDFSDIAALVNKFKSAPGAPIKARALLAGTNANGEIDPTPDVGFTHISACVDAFKGLPYPYQMAACP